MDKNQILNLGINDKRKWVRDNITESDICKVNSRGYAYLRTAECEQLIQSFFSGKPVETKSDKPDKNKQPEPSKPLAKVANNGKQVEQLTNLLSEMMQNQSAQLDEDAVRELVRSEVAKNTTAIKRLKVDFNGRDIETPTIESTRKDIEYMLADLSAGNNLFLTGPTGSGKTVLAKDLALAMGCKPDNIYTVSCEPFTFKGDFWGAYKSATEYVKGAFERASEDSDNGLQSCVILDEVTKLDPEIAGTLNAPLSHTKERKQFFTTGKGERREITDVYIIATANTWGKGFDSLYVGNQQQDLSLLNRFNSSKYYVDFDRELEKSLVDREVFDRLDKIRSKMLEHGIQHSITLRDMVNIHLAKQAGKPLDKSIGCLVADWTKDERAKVGNVPMD